MKKTAKLFIGIQAVFLMTAVAIPAQAALLIGGSMPLSGSVVTLRTSVPTTTQITSTPSSQGTQTTVSTPTITYVQNPSPSYDGSSVVSLRNLVKQPSSIPVTVTSPSTSTSTPTQGTQTNPTTTPSQTINLGQPNLGGSVVSLKNIYNQPTSIPVTVTSPPTTTSSPTSPTSSTPSTTPSLPAIPTVTALTPDEQQMVDMINQERVAAGVAPLKVDLRLASVGRAKASDMKANNYFDHTSPTYGSPWAMMQQVGLTVGWAGENIAGNNSVSGAMAALMQSPGHKANILDPRFTHVGVGIAYSSAYGNLYVQEFLQE